MAGYFARRAHTGTRIASNVPRMVTIGTLVAGVGFSVAAETVAVPDQRGGTGCVDIEMADQSRHRSMDTLRGYVRNAEIFKDHAGRACWESAGPGPRRMFDEVDHTDDLVKHAPAEAVATPAGENHADVGGARRVHALTEHQRQKWMDASSQ